MHAEGELRGARAALHPVEGALRSLARRRQERAAALHRRVFIMDDCEELLPPYLRFVRGVVDCDDLSLNVSREILQQNRQIQAIRRHLVRRLLGALKEMKDERPEKYRDVLKEFGPVLKEGLLGIEDGQERILELVLAPSSHGTAVPTSLAEYVARMKEGQPGIYYMTRPLASRRSSSRPTSRRSGPRATRCSSSPIRWTSCGCGCPASSTASRSCPRRRATSSPATEDEKKQAEESAASRRRASRICCSCCARSCRTRSRTCGCRAGSPRPPPAWWARRGLCPRAWPRCSAGRARRCRWPSASSS